MPIKPTKISDLEQEYYDLKNEYTKAMDKVHKKYADRVASLKAMLSISGKCSHQSVSVRKWYGSNGFGRHYEREGLSCNICSLVCNWPDSNSWFHPINDVTRDDD